MWHWTQHWKTIEKLSHQPEALLWGRIFCVTQSFRKKREKLARRQWIFILLLFIQRHCSLLQKKTQKKLSLLLEERESDGTFTHAHCNFRELGKKNFKVSLHHRKKKYIKRNKVSVEYFLWKIIFLCVRREGKIFENYALLSDDRAS